MSNVLPYKNADCPVSERVEDLLSRLTLEEKIGQLSQLFPKISDVSWMREKHIGSVLGADSKESDKLQKEVGEKHRLGVPVLFGYDCIHGHAFHEGATVFPSQLAMGCSWNPEICEEMARITAREMAVTGVHWTFSPVLCIARDLRWGRVNETFGEDPLLISELGKAMIRGYQGNRLSDRESVAACAKHYAGYSETIGGRDSTETQISERFLRQYFFPPFFEAVKAGCKTFMAGYQAIDGVPCSANRWLLTKVLREEWGFDGFVISDWDNIGKLVEEHFISKNEKEAAALALKAGNDMNMANVGFLDGVKQAVEEGLLDEEIINESCRRILRIKFDLGLFDKDKNKCYPDLDKIDKVVGCAEHMEVSRKAGEQSIVLLKNDGILPLDEQKVKKIAVLGPNADDIMAQLGDWSRGCGNAADDPNAEMHPREQLSSVLDGVRSRAGTDYNITYAKGADVSDTSTGDVAKAVKLAKDAAVSIVVVGDNKSMVGEGKDRAKLELTGSQQALLEAVHATGTPMVVVLIASKPLAIPWVKEHANAILCPFNQGSKGGDAVAGILFGDVSPSAKLNISFPYTAGQLPVYYNQIPGWHEKGYVDLPKNPDEPLFAFGFGLSYTTYEYSNLTLKSKQLENRQSLKVS
ncbi:MAG: glycoside hydrolase family 3 N-terminal domain-containing protein, partial [Candidatus Auribacterota bacterium]|nr:glycoside hydrolase family 3 N-terminal domain-containing protein [Candidatus Auribacterota bacterium]